MENALRNWKCRNCGRANRTEVALDGTAKCEYCTYLMSVQPSRVRNGVTLPSSYPTRRGTISGDANGRPLGEAN
jgi:DNA-directed RNA polymerase subunit RPC12/RpoP